MLLSKVRNTATLILIGGLAIACLILFMRLKSSANELAEQRLERVRLAAELNDAIAEATKTRTITLAPEDEEAVKEVVKAGATPTARVEAEVRKREEFKAPSEVKRDILRTGDKFDRFIVTIPYRLTGVNCYLEASPAHFDINQRFIIESVQLSLLTAECPIEWQGYTVTLREMAPHDDRLVRRWSAAGTDIHATFTTLPPKAQKRARWAWFRPWWETGAKYRTEDSIQPYGYIGAQVWKINVGTGVSGTEFEGFVGYRYEW